MQNLSNFEERIRSAKAEIAALLAGERSLGANAHLPSAIRVAAGSQSDYQTTQGKQPLNRKERADYDREVKAAEEIALTRWAVENDLWVDANAFLKKYANRFLDEGAEQKVYLGQNGKTVIKLNSGIYHSTWLEYFIRLIFHSALFSSTQYSS